jgi:hypothetical protein
MGDHNNQKHYRHIQIEYGDSVYPKKTDRRIIQLELPPEQCLQLASSLIGVANHMIEEKLTNGSQP